MANAATTSVDQRVLERYLNDFYNHTDLVYRFGVLLTISREGAEKLTEETFRKLLEEFSQVGAAINPQEHLMGLAWQAWDKLKNERFHEWSHPVLAALKVLSHDERAALFVVDMAGMAAGDAASKLMMSERDLRNLLASARERLVSSEITL